jgi:YidC/Oxa1 family membrane protein insertase
MTDMRRTLLWVVFTMSLVLIWDAWNKHTGQPTLFGAPPASKTAPAAAPPAGAGGVAGTAASGALGVPVPSALPAATSAVAAPNAVPAASPAVAAAAAADRLVITTDVFKVTFDAKGATLVRVELLRHVDQNDRSRNVMLFDQSADRLYIAQTGLVPPNGGAGLPNHHTPMKALPGARALADGSNELQVQFESDEVGGVKLLKTFTFKRGDYLVGVRHEVVNGSAASIDPRLYLQLVRDGNAPAGESSFYFTFTGPAVFTTASNFQKIDFKSIAKRGPGDKPDHVTLAEDGWIAMVQHYFASAWLVDPVGTTRLPREYYSGKVDNNQYSVGMFVPMGAVAPGASKAFDALLFVGPQEEKKLEAMATATPIRAERLDLVKDYGWFTILAKPLFWLLDQLHRVLGNWGWAIVALVVLLKIAFYWLNASAYRSMAKMKAVSPRVAELRERLKDKPQLMQQEMMRIYREEKVNPLGGCLPIVAQMPFFIALYWVLLSSVEMRNAPWILWINDLSAIDPYYILPILMTGSSLLQTWLNPTPPDPVQARLMWMMPLIFGVMFFFFPAGLVLYWLTNNILSIAQQYFINKRLGVLGK